MNAIDGWSVVGVLWRGRILWAKSRRSIHRSHSADAVQHTVSVSVCLSVCLSVCFSLCVSVYL